jgi:hypothetical protein
MTPYALITIGCLIVITGVVVYFPIIFIRKTDKILKVLEQIAANSRKP